MYYIYGTNTLHIPRSPLNQMASLLPILIFSLLAVASAGEHNFITTSFARKTIKKTKISHLHFYFHDTVSGKNPTAISIIKPQTPSMPLFGFVNMMDDPLTVGPEPNSKRIGSAQGFYASSCQEELSFLMTMNLYFTEGKYNGSVLSVLGRNAPLHPVREMSIVGGSGLFRFATGYALAHTYWLDLKTADAIVEYNVTVMHY